MIKNLLFLFVILILSHPIKAQEHFITYNKDSEKSLISNAKSPDDMASKNPLKF
jgi:hypothetical protein